MRQPRSIFERQVSPFQQAAVTGVGAILIMTISWALGKFGLFETKDVFPWELAFSGILFYAFFNAVFSLAQKGQGLYFLYSLIAYMLLALVLGLSARFFSGLSIDEAGSFRWILIIFTFSYLLLISIVGSMKKIVQLAQKQEEALREEADEN